METNRSLPCREPFTCLQTQKHIVNGALYGQHHSNVDKKTCYYSGLKNSQKLASSTRSLDGRDLSGVATRHGGCLQVLPHLILTAVPWGS